MKYLVDIDGEDDYKEVTSDTFHQEERLVVFFDFYRNLDGTVVEGAVTKIAAFPVENILSIITVGEDEED